MNIDNRTLGGLSDLAVSQEDDREFWVVPSSSDTSYLSHGYVRYIGKFPPQIASKLIDDFYPGKGGILDPMVGGGTVLTESVIRGIKCEGWDINPFSVLTSRCTSRSVDQCLYEEAGDKIIRGLGVLDGNLDLFGEHFKKWKRKGLHLKYCEEYFDDKTQEELEYALHVIDSTANRDNSVADLLLLTVLACLRRISFANVKKMNIELDLEKKTKSSLHKEFTKHHSKIAEINSNLPENFGKRLADVHEKSAMRWTSDRSYGMILIHPPYLTNTAFSESTSLQLAILGINHKDIWKKELRCRGSFLHEPNGLKKYLVNWAKIMLAAKGSLTKGGVLAIVIGDGQIDGVRMPVGTISLEFAKDLGLRFVKHSYHILKNNTGRTQNRKMKGQHVIVFAKS